MCSSLLKAEEKDRLLMVETNST